MTTFEYCGPTFSQLTFMREYNMEAKIREAKLPWTIWGNITESANFHHSPELMRLPMIRSAEAREDLNKEAAAMGALYTYRQLKQTWLAHMSTPVIAETTRNRNENALSTREAEVVEAALAQYAEYLNRFGMNLQPFEPEDIDRLRLSAIFCRLAQNPPTAPQAEGSNNTEPPATQGSDPFVTASQPTPANTFDTKIPLATQQSSAPYEPVISPSSASTAHTQRKSA
ncbi:uncharacterized protein BJX67DRAFT_367066 [Aspergillus lucknowensis]|uniref:Uncharacterized protein n=1 Tax=Aspergillus lucknowensis TaxID=176173 RepID=A0ABR4L9K8_9EURO